MTVGKEFISTAGEAYSRGDLDTAEKIYTKILKMGVYNGWVNFCLGRIERDRGNLSSAVDFFKSSIEQDSEFIWPYYELIRIRDKTTQDIDIPYCLQRIQALTTPEIAAQFGSNLEKVYHIAFDSGFRLEAGTALSNLRTMYDVSIFALVRILETTDDPEKGKDLIERISTAEELGVDEIRVALDSANRLRLPLTNELDLARRYKLKQPNDFQGYIRLVRILAASDDQIALDALFEEAAKFTKKQVAFLGIISAIEQSHSEAAFFRTVTFGRLFNENPLFPTIRLAYLLMESGALSRLQTILSMLDAFHSESSDVAVLSMIVAQREFAFERAEEIYLERLAVLAPPPANARYAWIDLLISLGRQEEALRQLEVELTGASKTHNLINLAMRVYLETQNWQLAFDFGLNNLSPSLSMDGFFGPLVRCARKMGLQKHLLDRLMIINDTGSPAVRLSISALIEDQIDNADPDMVEYIGKSEFSLERRHRFEAKAHAAGLQLAATVPQRAVFYCADRAYFVPAMVSIISFAMNNVLVSRHLKFFILLDDDVYADERLTVAHVSQRIGVEISCLPASSLVSGSSSLRSEYGLVTGGQSLSVAAYYRIFLASKLAEMGEFSEGLYIDSDTLIRSGIGGLFDIEMDKPLMARSEVERPEVQYAVDVNKINGRYFNSGVLRFNFNHTGTKGLIGQALDIALGGQHKLIFQDQCALNIAFDGGCQPLSERFNHFIGPDVSEDEISRRDGVVLHYLDRPKPWDGLYRRRAGEWFDWYALFWDVVKRRSVVTRDTLQAG